ncbi:MAG: 30S ribosomal protein S20 [Gammaproteobacteria bacterium]|jgi:small subunit ribosomal protein S20
MANSKQSIKRAKQNDARYVLKHAQRSKARTAVKAVKNAITAKDTETAKKALIQAEKLLDSTASKKVIHKNKAARLKSRLSKAVKSLSV